VATPLDSSNTTTFKNASVGVKRPFPRSVFKVITIPCFMLRYMFLDRNTQQLYAQKADKIQK